MTKQEALVHAAWIMALADDKDEFEQILEDVMVMWGAIQLARASAPSRGSLNGCEPS